MSEINLDTHFYCENCGKIESNSNRYEILDGDGYTNWLCPNCNNNRIKGFDEP